ncbi:MAG: hypothetical protein Tsb0020_40770 [Haliangiales bacterium]
MEREERLNATLASTLIEEQDASGIYDGSRHPCLTVLYHPDMARIGQRAALGGLVLRKPEHLSRLFPKFVKPGQLDGHSLRDPFLSRRPIRLEYVGDEIAIAPPSGVAIEFDDAAIESQRVAGEARISPEALTRGVLLTLSRRIVLLLHEVALRGEYPAHWDLVGDSDAVVALREQIARVGDIDVPVLIRGETGVGKERVAQAIHAASERRRRKLVAINMAAVPASTAVSELFGHQKGAFTNATGRHLGLFERADGSTLFLDEIGETPIQVQTMLLRALAEGTIRPLGAERDHEVDVRVIAATDADLERAGEDGSFRSALKYRLAGYEIHVPPLRQRREDIPRLVAHFLREELANVGESDHFSPPETVRKLWFPPELMRRLYAHDWPGNVRQLRNTVRQLVISSRGASSVRIDAAVERALSEKAAPAAASAAPAQPAPGAWHEATVKESIDNLGLSGDKIITDSEVIAALEQVKWMPSRAAVLLGIPRASLYDLMERAPGVRKANDISRDELADCFRDCDGDLDAMVDRLRVSRRSIMLRMRRLGLPLGDE